MNISNDGHCVYVTTELNTLALIEAMGDLAMYCQSKGLEIVSNEADVSDNTDGTITIRFGIWRLG